MLLVVVVVEGRSDSLAEFVWKVLARLELDGDYVISGLYDCLNSVDRTRGVRYLESESENSRHHRAM